MRFRKLRIAFSAMCSMRPRFSLKWLLVGITLAAVILYSLFIYPTVVAHRFARAVEHGDYQYALSFIEEEPRKTIAERLAVTEKSTVKVTISRRVWRDIWNLQRSIQIRVIPGERGSSSSQLPNVGLGGDGVATMFGIRHLKIYLMTYGPSPSGITMPSQVR